MELKIDEITLIYSKKDEVESKLIGEAIAETVKVLKNTWDLNIPENCKVEIMRSPMKLLFKYNPWWKKIILALFLPLVYPQVLKVWKMAGGWNIPYDDGPVVGIKPAGMLERTEESISNNYISDEKDPDLKIKQVACHELTHAFTAHLKLPMWLNEGLALYAVDLYFNRQTVEANTLRYLSSLRLETPEKRIEQSSRSGIEDILKRISFGYWLVRYLQENKNTVLNDILNEQQDEESIKASISGSLGISEENFWQEAGGMLMEYFDRER